MVRKRKEVRLEERLLLHAWVNDLLGYERTKDLLKGFREVDEGFDAHDTSGVYRYLTSHSEQVKVPFEDLRRYDDNIRRHLEKINRLRAEPVTLRYFQHLSLLYTEIFLDRYSKAPTTLASELNEFARQMDSGAESFTQDDLGKLAFWMATGSGKTLLMHLNYHQFLHYDTAPLDNILLITTNEDLTEQHLDEMSLSGIPCERFTPEESGLRLAEKDMVRATEITKLTEEKKGQGVSVDVEAFEGRNLILVDEGHRGLSVSDSKAAAVWSRLRERLAEQGFTFEYSATFGQAVQASKSEALADEYGKAILFDYSYRHFHGDGYGKDFEVLNLKNQNEEYTDLLLLGNLISFYEQRRFFSENREQAKEYNLESPLWVFVGSRVNAVYTANKQARSDVLTVLRFLHRFLRNEGGWSVETVEKLLAGETGLDNSADQDAFEGRFRYLKERNTSPEEIFDGILREVFHAGAGASLQVSDIKGAEGELGLKVSGDNRYFGLVYIGDTSAFKKLLEEEPGMPVEEDAISSSSLFEDIEADDSPVNLLIGARKFTEGWSSWRVSAMGLLNIGKSEGSQIIQLFGRGVRLKGRDFLMKRSEALDGKPPRHLELLETLNIFAVEANYMAQFREYLEREGVDPEGYEDIELPIRENKEFLNRGLLVPKVPEKDTFAGNKRLLLDATEDIKVSLDLSARAETLGMSGEKVATESAKAGVEQRISEKHLSMLDWETIHLDLLDHKDRKGFHNLVIQPCVPREIMSRSEPAYRLVADASLAAPKDFLGLGRLQQTVQEILRKYTETFYRVRQQRWDSDHMVAEELTAEHENFADYTVKVRRSKEELIGEIESLIEQEREIYERDLDRPPTLHFDRHLFQPLLVENGDDVKSSPPALNPSEKSFASALRRYCQNKNGASSPDREIFLLRNLSRGKGIGFFNTLGFYPDFILWVREGGGQRVVFVEPHGMRNDPAPEHNDKVRLYRELETLSQSIAARQGLENLTLDSYIISATPFEELKKQWSGGWSRERFAEEHILFEDELEATMSLLIEGSNSKHRG
ncbi:MAG: DEAD/DEAH box helicase family protein [Rubrobacter sp.]|nr:DEAD/DEAH box helicase family protein [Rubrobacter sp.]